MINSNSIAIRAPTLTDFLLSLFAGLSGFFSGLIFDGRPDAYLPSDIFVFMVVFVSLLASSRVERPRLSFWLYILSLLYLVVLIAAGDGLSEASTDALKIFMFFFIGEYCLLDGEVALRVFRWTVIFLNGLLAASLLIQPLSDVAKYMCPPLYCVALFVPFAVSRAMGKLVVLPIIISIYGATFGGYRGSALGIVLLIVTYLLLVRPFIWELLRRHIKLVLVMLFVVSVAVPIAIASSLVVDILQNNAGLGTKSDVERSMMIIIAAQHLTDHPLVGMGYKAGAALIRNDFEAFLEGYDATSSLHNQFLDFLYFSGALGALIMVIYYYRLLLKVVAVSWQRKGQIASAPGGLRAFDSSNFVRLLPALSLVSIVVFITISPFSASVRQFCLILLSAVGAANLPNYVRA